MPRPKRRRLRRNDDAFHKEAGEQQGYHQQIKCTNLPQGMEQSQDGHPGTQRKETDIQDSRAQRQPIEGLALAFACRRCEAAPLERPRG